MYQEYSDFMFPFKQHYMRATIDLKKQGILLDKNFYKIGVAWPLPRLSAIIQNQKMKSMVEEYNYNTAIAYYPDHYENCTNIYQFMQSWQVDTNVLHLPLYTHNDYFDMHSDKPNIALNSNVATLCFGMIRIKKFKSNNGRIKLEFITGTNKFSSVLLQKFGISTTSQIYGYEMNYKFQEYFQHSVPIIKGWMDCNGNIIKKPLFGISLNFI